MKSEQVMVVRGRRNAGAEAGIPEARLVILVSEDGRALLGLHLGDIAQQLRIRKIAMKRWGGIKPRASRLRPKSRPEP